MRIIRNITNGILILVIGVMHTKFTLSPNVFGKQFQEFSRTYFFNSSKGIDGFPPVVGQSNFIPHAAFWCFYFGVLLIPLGLLVHAVEKKNKILPQSFTISYLIFVLIGSYMVPGSGMTFFMLPHAIYMLVSNSLKRRKCPRLA